MIDLHSHILPGVDDGSKSLDESRAMLALLREQGVERVVATPHFYPRSDTVAAFLERRKAAAEMLDEDLVLGAEVAYFSAIGHSKELGALTLGKTKLLLVEMPYAPWTEDMVRKVCMLPTRTGLTPVLAHVDRYRSQLRRWGKLFLDSGVYFQCNADAFLSWKSRRWALKQLSLGHIHFLGSDSHNLQTRPPRLGNAAQVITKKLGSEPLEQLTAFTKKMLEIGPLV